jgi:hypothetical protein
MESRADRVGTEPPSFFQEKYMHPIKHILNRPVFFGGQEHSGWLPDNAIQPQPTPLRTALLDIHIYNDGAGYILEWKSRTTPDQGDTWHETLAGAEQQAQRDFGIEPTEWLLAEADESMGSTRK